MIGAFHPRWRIRRAPIFLYAYVALCTSVLIGAVRHLGVSAATGRQAGGVGASVPIELTALMRESLQAVNTHDPRALAPYTTGDPAVSFGWVAETTTRQWQGDVLPLPSVHATLRNAGISKQDAVFLAVFHAWHTCESDGDHVHLLTHTADGWRLGGEIPETDPCGFHVRDHDLRVSIDVPSRTARISDHVRIERMQDTTPPFCLLRISQDFRVRQFLLDGAPASFRQAGGILTFAPPASKTFTVSLQYAGVVEHRGSDYILPDEATLNSYWYPHIARLPATATITVTAPPGWIPIAQGELLHRQRGPDDAIEVTYRNDVPTSFFTVDMGRYHVTTRQVNGRTLSACLMRNDPAFASRCLDELQHALAFYATHFSRFPYTHYAVVETRGPFEGALEAYSFATFQANTLPGTIAHELAHTWWGGLVPCTYTRSMWDESFADYSDDLCERMTRDSHLLQNGNADHRAYGHRFDAFSMTEAHDTSDGKQSAVGYDKGALVLRVLEEQIGRDTMLRCLRAFLADHSRGEPAEWPDFAHEVNQVTGQDYTWFFRQWTQQKGLPALSLAHVVARRDAQGYLVEADVLQTTPPYRLRVPILLQTQAGDPVISIVEAEGSSTHVRLHTRFAPTRLALDPDNILPLATAEATSYNFATD